MYTYKGLGRQASRLRRQRERGVNEKDDPFAAPAAWKLKCNRRFSFLPGSIKQFGVRRKEKRREILTG